MPIVNLTKIACNYFHFLGSTLPLIFFLQLGLKKSYLSFNGYEYRSIRQVVEKIIILSIQPVKLITL